jgi:hypothetical protein
MEEAAGVIRLVNRRERRWTVALLVLAGLFGLIGIAISINEGVSVPLTVLGLLLNYAAIALAILVLPRLLGAPIAQPWLEISSDGLNYGGRQFVPWENVVAARVGRSAPLARRREVFVLQDWSPRGVLARVIPRKAVPLEDFEPRWQSFGVTEHVERWAPHVEMSAEQ